MKLKRMHYTSCLTGVLWLVLLSGTSRSDDSQSTSPTAAERQAVAALHAAGASIQINGNFEVISVSFSSRSRATDADLAHLKALPKLATLMLTGSQFTDAAVEHLRGLQQLRSVRVWSTARLTDSRIAALKQALPECRISQFPSRRSSDDPRSRPPVGSSAPDPSTMFGRLRYLSVQAELKVTDEQKAKIREHLQRQRPSRSALSRDYIEKLRAAQTDEQREIIRAEYVSQRQNQQKQDEDACRQILTAKQFSRLQQLVWHSLGVQALSRDDFTAGLQLTEQQAEQIKTLLTERTNALRRRGPGPSRQEYATLQAEWDEKIRAVLTAEQKEAWTKMLGPTPTVSPRGPRFRSSGLQSDVEARSVFRRLDRDNDAMLTAEELSHSGPIRQRFERANIELSFPVPRDDFIKMYSRILASQRDSSTQRNRD